MANDNHLLSVPCYNGLCETDYYNDFLNRATEINFSFFELCLPDDDPVYTLKSDGGFRFFWLISQLFRSGKNRVQSNHDVCCSYLRNMRGIRAVDRIVELCEEIWLLSGLPRAETKRDAFYEFKNKN